MTSACACSALSRPCARAAVPRSCPSSVSWRRSTSGSRSPRARTFKVESKRADKSFPYPSPQISAEVGAFVLSRFPHLKVDVHNPDFTVHVEVRDHLAFVHGDADPAAGGLPVSSSGRGTLMLSGGIDLACCGLPHGPARPAR